MDEKLKKDIAAIVAEIFSAKEEAEMMKKTESALQTSADKIEALTASLEELTMKHDEVLSTIVEHETTAADLESKLEAAEKEIEGANQKLAESEASIEEMKKDRAAELRMSELVTAGVSSSDKEAQEAKVREMSDKDFAAYKVELVSLREAVVAELSKSALLENQEEGEEGGEAEGEDAGEEGEEGEGENASEGGEEAAAIPPVNIDPGNAISAALNMEILPSKGLTEKYAELGKAMAESFKQ